MSKRLQEKRKANLKKGAKSSNYLLINSKIGERKMYTRFAPTKNKNIKRRYSVDLKKINDK